MSTTLRQQQILAALSPGRRVTVEDLAKRFDVTVQTIRRDLGEMAEAGLLDRVHGGAVARAGAHNISYEMRQSSGAGAKAAIGRACAAAIPDNSSLIMNIGTTTEAVAQALSQHSNLTVITNNINIANILRFSPGCEIIVAGGTLRRADGGLVGDLTAQFFGQFKPDFAVMGCSAVDADGDMLDFDLSEVRVSQAILRQARQRFIVADHSKFRRSAPARIANLADVDALFTDRPLAPALQERCEAAGTAVRIAPDVPGET